jgi:DNA-binding winged helix-turn-helix (wHTH) protein
MHLLSCLARHAPDVVTKEQIFREVWEGAFVTDEALTFVIWELRKALGDDAKRPRFI